QPRFERENGVTVRATFGAVGALRDALRAGAPCDVLIVSDTMIEALAASGAVRTGSRSPIGRVATAIAVPAGAPLPAIDSGEALKATLLAASALYFPDATLSTAGAHVASLLDRLAIREQLAPRLRMFANGATAMRALADAGDAHALGCTQATEIRATPGLALVGALPPPFDLATVYSAAVAATTPSDDAARRFIALIAGAASKDLREAGGFDAGFASAWQSGSS
ncbi:MAG TPA: substrate-binding domain-containing protein, partial [Caldimonas sp.]